MNTITQDELAKLCQNGKAIDSKGGYPAVVIHPDDTITKLWARKKKLLSSATLRPYSNRFVFNAEELARRGITVPEIINHAAVAGSHIRIVTYRSLDGHSIRELLKTNPEKVDISALAKYIYGLHQKGILFRGMHLGNIIQQPQDRGYGLIDFTDVKFYEKPVPPLRRAANLATPLRYREDIKRIKKAGLGSLNEAYMALLTASESEKEKFRQTFNDYIKR